MVPFRTGPLLDWWNHCPGLAPISGSSRSDIRLDLRRDESIPRPSKMDEEITSVVNRALFRQQALAHVWIMNLTRDVRGTIYSVRHHKATAEMALL